MLLCPRRHDETPEPLILEYINTTTNRKVQSSRFSTSLNSALDLGTNFWVR
ncbi:hypothetical protein PILCRDRAFT_677361 [Piloderma croceum F 1598]|uniref:Uncharacterized protein n=1 Tax=Piloderma croceum (strain F 1598) TaxID=765440 RepID=A0A0C3F653_PILCF|nr:hypothetical protein PILCRDRAFT_677361 [Piloderma croceum F 1598]